MVVVSLGPRLAANNFISAVFPSQIALPKFLVALAYIFFSPTTINALITFEQPKHRK